MANNAQFQMKGVVTLRVFLLRVVLYIESYNCTVPGLQFKSEIATQWFPLLEAYPLQHYTEYCLRVD